ncbi:uncharacterized protein N7483_008185 [Penicillium malachiteum]|uniref:uncharacterized protein n=1 Tax=Penicillium malachiteum TaxID=1324776 RepID=UPI00254684B7|nr:uncharacterized protein N7483_008185 [Penicillium malachiteum]KAJ5720251.1 hypothetical protein N7483_008185 [Penicillium malachiteum]
MEPISSTDGFSILPPGLRHNTGPSDCQLDLDVEALWKDFPDAPTPPPCLATADTTPHYNSTAISPNPRPEIEYILFSIPESKHGFYWFGPDPLAPDTCAADIFSHISAFTFMREVVWIEFELCKVSLITGETIERHLFYLPRRHSFLGNLTQIRRLMLEHISSYDHETATGLYRLRLSIYPRQGLSPKCEIRSKVICGGDCDGSALDPIFFVQNVAANFQNP